MGLSIIEPGRLGQGRFGGRLPVPESIAVSGDGRYLLQDGTPWLANVAAGGWHMIQAVSNADSASFFDTIAAAGFNACHVNLVANDTLRYGSTSGNHYAAPNWNNGSSVPPFSTPGRFDTFAATYKTHARERVDYMLSKGIVPMLLLAYPGAGGDAGSSDQGWAAQMLADTDAHLQTYGAAAETLFADVAKLMWIAGGDVEFTNSTLLARTMAAVAGVQSVNANRLWLAHLTIANGDAGILPFEDATIGAISGMLWSQYLYKDDLYRAWWRIEEAYAHSPTRPAFVFDPAYEEDPGPTGYMSRTRLRQRTHSTMCAGACSMAYGRGDDLGNGSGWYFSKTSSWTTTLPGLADHQQAYTFWSSLPWWAMAPDTTSQFATAGRGTHSDTSDSYVTVRASAACLVAYWQPGTTNTLTVNMAQFTGAGFVSGSGTRRARWFDPVSGSYTLINGSLATSGTQNFQNSASNNASGATNDRLLVID